MKNLLVILSLSSLVMACAQATPVTTPSGNRGFAVSCVLLYLMNAMRRQAKSVLVVMKSWINRVHVIWVSSAPEMPTPTAAEMLLPTERTLKQITIRMLEQTIVRFL